MNEQKIPLLLPAPAKINLHLRVTAILENGMHELDTSFAFVDIADQLTFEPAGDIAVGCSVADLSGPDNLVHKVLVALRRQYGIGSGLHVHIDKQIPAQAGLGGGSSDAATAIIAANRLWQLGMSTDAMIEFAAPYGADIPCFLFGRASQAHGIGEKLLPYEQPLPTGSLLLAWPGTGLSTAAVFRQFDHSEAGRTLTLPGGADTMRRGPARLGENDLEASASALSPALARLLQHLRNHSQQAWMSGSGSACAALFDTSAEATAMAAQLQELGLASWTHAGRLLNSHPTRDNNDWGVAKR